MTQCVDGWRDRRRKGARRNVKTCRIRGGRGGAETLGISEWDESVMGGDRNGERMVRCGTMMSSLYWFISTVKGKKKTCIAALVGTAEGGSHVLHHPLFLSFVFPHMDVISSNLSGFVKWQPDRDWGIMFCCQNMTLGYKMLWLDKVCTDTEYTDSSETSMMHVLSSAFGFVKCCPLSPFRHASPAYYYFSNSECQSSSNNLKRRAGIGMVEIWGLTLALPTCYPTTVKCPKEGVWNWIEMEERQAGELKAHTDRLRKRKSECSENKPQKLLQPLGNLLKAHKSKVCYNTWSYNGDPFHRFSFLQGEFFFLFLIFFFFNRTLQVNEGLAALSVTVHESWEQPHSQYSLSCRFDLLYNSHRLDWCAKYLSQPSKESHIMHYSKQKILSALKSETE